MNVPCIFTLLMMVNGLNQIMYFSSKRIKPMVLSSYKCLSNQKEHTCSKKIAGKKSSYYKCKKKQYRC